MKGFITALLISTSLMFAIVYFAVNKPLSEIQTTIVDAEYPSAASESSDESSLGTGGISTVNVSYQERISKGDTLMESSYFALAIVEYQFASKLEPELAEPFQKLGKAYFNENDYEKALPHLQLAAERNPEDNETQVLIGKSMIKVGQYQEASDHFNGLPFENTEVLYYRGILYAYFNDFENAQTQFNRVIDAGDSPELAQSAANFLAAMTEYGLAEEGPESYRLTLIGRSLAQTGEPKMAVELLYNVLRDEPDYRDAWIILGYSYLTLEQYEDAEDALIKAVELDPTKPESRYFLGLSYFGLDDYSSALTQIELALENGFEPKIQAYQKLGDTAVLTQDYQKAVDAYENVLLLNSSDVELYIRPIWLYIDQLNNVERALELAKRATLEHPDEALSYSLFGWAETVAGDYEAAEKSLNYALVLDYDNAAAHLNFGRLYELQGDMENAKAHYKEAYTLAPEDSVGQLAADLYNKIIDREAEAAAAEAAAQTATVTNNHPS